MRRFIQLTEETLRESAKKVGADPFVISSHVISMEDVQNAFVVRIAIGDEERVIKDRNGPVWASNSAESAEQKGLPVSGYKPTQPADAIAAVNVFKELEERVLRHIDRLEDDDTEGPDVDDHWLYVGRTQLQQAFMTLNRAIFQPQRVTLPEDAQTTEPLTDVQRSVRDGSFGVKSADVGDGEIGGEKHDMPITAVLRNVKRIPYGDDPRAPCLYGAIYGDIRGRFPDGLFVTTSTIVAEDGDVVRTRNSSYRIESWAADEISNAEAAAGGYAVDAED